MGNTNLNSARKVKNDEFYTKFWDIEREIESYLEFNPDVFRGGTILLPCDDPEESSFTRFFASSFERLGLRKLISTSYSEGSQGKKFILEADKTGDGRINIHDIEWEYLAGDGDFRSPEVCALRDEADFIITNPPFSIFRIFMDWIFASNKNPEVTTNEVPRFLVLGSMNAITYREVFPRIKSGKMWLGAHNGAKTYLTPEGVDKKLGNTCWFTNMEHGRRHQPLGLMSMGDNLRYSRHKSIREKGYKHYDNYDAIEVSFTDAIPSDYNKVMGVPLSYLEKHCPEQFEIVGLSSNGSVEDAMKLPHFKKHHEPFINNKSIYQRIFIRHRGTNENFG